MTDRPDLHAPVEGGEIAGWRSGTGPPALLLHGGPGLSDYTQGLADELAPYFTCIRYQQRGLPPSVVEGDKTVEGHVTDAIAVLDALSIREAVVVGHSWGAGLALEIAIAHPECVKAVVWITGIGVSGDGGWSEFDAEIIRRLPPEDADRAAALNDLADATEAEQLELMALAWPGYASDPAHPPPLPDLRIDAAGFTLTYTSIIERLGAGTLADGLRDLSCPVLLIGAEDDPAPKTTIEEIVELIPHAEVRIIPKCGHFTWMERPGVTGQIVGDWLATLGDPQRSPLGWEDP